MRVFVTGVCGQLGHDVVNELIARGHEAVAGDITEQYSGADDGSAVVSAPYKQLDITDSEAVKAVLTEVQAIPPELSLSQQKNTGCQRQNAPITAV